MPEIVVPAPLAAFHAARGEAGRAWIESIPGRANEFLSRWDLRLDGEPMHGLAALVLPVLRTDGTPAALKLPVIEEQHRGEAAALRAWHGDGAVRLLEHDPDSWVMLLERLGRDDLRTVPDELEAVRIIATLLRRLHARPAPAGVPLLGDVAAEMVAEEPMRAASAGSPEHVRLMSRWAAATAEVATEPGDRLLHWDLHYQNVLSAGREPWLAIDPKPLAGDPGFDLLPALRNRWQRSDPVPAVRRRFDLMVDILDLDRDRATAWTYARLLQNAIWNVEAGDPAVDDESIQIDAAISG